MFGLLLDAVDDILLGVEDGSEDLGSTDIQTDVVHSGHDLTSFNYQPTSRPRRLFPVADTALLVFSAFFL